MSEENKILGEALIELLSLRVKKNGRIDTSWGDKSPTGLGATVRRIVRENSPFMSVVTDADKAIMREKRKGK